MDHSATAIIGPSRQDWLFALQEINDTSLNSYFVMVVTTETYHFFSFFLFKIKSALILNSMKTEIYSLLNLKREADCIVLVNSMKDETTNEIQVKIRHALIIFLRSQF